MGRVRPGGNIADPIGVARDGSAILNSMQSLDSSQQQQSRRTTLTVSRLSLTVMIIVLLVAIVFAANQNDVIGWLVVIISGAWLILAIIAMFWVRKGARAISRQATTLNANLAAQANPGSASGGGTTVVDESTTDPMRDTKLDHSFKIVEVQKRVISQELAKGQHADMEMIDRALDTIEMTAANARDMIRPDRHRRSDDDQDSGGGAVSGTVIN